MAESSTTGTQGSTDGNPYDLDKIDPASLPQEMRDIYNNMLTDYRAKTAVAAEHRREAQRIQDEHAAQQAELAKYQQELQGYRQYYEQSQPILQQYAQSLQQQSSGSGDPDTSGYMTDDDLAKQFEQQLAQRDQQIAQLTQKVDQYAQQFMGAMGLQEQVQNLRGIDPNIDTARVLEKAKQLNSPDLQSAYKLAYEDELREQYAKQQAEEAVAEARKAWEQEQANNAIAPGSLGGPALQPRQVLEPVDREGAGTGWTRARMQAGELLTRGAG